MPACLKLIQSFMTAGRAGDHLLHDADKPSWIISMPACLELARNIMTAVVQVITCCMMQTSSAGSSPCHFVRGCPRDGVTSQSELPSLASPRSSTRHGVELLQSLVNLNLHDTGKIISSRKTKKAPQKWLMVPNFQQLPFWLQQSRTRPRHQVQPCVHPNSGKG